MGLVEQVRTHYPPTAGAHTVRVVSASQSEWMLKLPCAIARLLQFDGSLLIAHSQGIAAPKAKGAQAATRSRNSADADLASGPFAP